LRDNLVTAKKMIGWTSEAAQQAAVRERSRAASEADFYRPRLQRTLAATASISRR
jgi:hypothetical protein